MARLSLVTAPTEEPVSIDEAIQHLRLDCDDDASLVNTLISVARELAENDTNQRFVTQTLDWTIDQFPCSRYGILHFPTGPVQSVTSVSYTDTNGDSQTWSNAEWLLDTSGPTARLSPAYSESYPTTRYEMASVTIRFVAGFGDAASDVPEVIKQAIKLLVADMYFNRSSSSYGVSVKDLSTTAHTLLARYRING